jgi:acetylornithine deacetylase/succinyl-diaminopimelate desuccinylase-like protein
VAGDAEVRRCVEEACAICEIPAPTGSEARRAAWVAERLREAGLEPRIDAEGSVLAGEGDVVVAAHLDTVFAGIDDIAVRREGDVLHAPGIGDNSLGVAALLFLARRRPQGLVLAATVGEEGLGNLRGARRVVADLRPREFIAVEGGGAGGLVTTGVGAARFSIRVTTPGGHSWSDRGSPSALHLLVDLLHRHVDRPLTTSANIGSIHGGAGINVLAPEAEATLEFRDDDEARLEAAVRRLAGEAGPHVEIAELGRRPAGRVAPDHPLVRSALEAAAAAGLAPPRLEASSTDANAALGAGIPAVTVGLCESHDAHTPEERVDVGRLRPALSALADLVSRRGPV